jgi:enamine deaminase RidA (YjgF/YER057c/UK114 family)
MTEQRFRDDTGWQQIGGYSRAIRRGNIIAVSGSTAHGPEDNALYPGDTYAQTVHCLAIVVRALEALGGGIADIVRTRLLLAPGASWQDATRAHGDVMAAVAPANSTYYVHSLIGEGFLVEAEADAVLLT